jgi:DNA primase
MQSHTSNYDWLLQRGITPEVIALFNIDPNYDHPTAKDCIRIPITESFSKYRRNPMEDIKPKYLYDTGGKVTLYGSKNVNWGDPVLITEGELDTLVAWSQNIQAVSSTGGAMSFQEEWADEFVGRGPAYVCFDNDDAGARGMVKVLEYIPDAHIVLIPEAIGTKDISDYVSKGGDLHDLLATAKQYPDIATVEADMKHRNASWQSTRFHKAYLDKHRQATHDKSYDINKYEGDDKVLRAKSVPMTDFIDFTRRKACCPWHNERTPSLHYYPKTNSAYCFGGCGRAYDTIDAYRLTHNVSFLEAVSELNKMV